MLMLRARNRSHDDDETYLIRFFINSLNCFNFRKILLTNKLQVITSEYKTYVFVYSYLQRVEILEF